ncbi:hypothetical protein K3495_g6271 [Podosphaera aphanis]|nr:hypothetical protein K3495_g6271 [Podosphaera aphanis]
MIFDKNCGSHYIELPHFANLAFALMINNCDEELPNTIQEAMGSSDSLHWKEAIQSELKILEEKKILSNRWIFTKKFDEKGNLTRYKARLVAQGFSQGYIYQYSDTFSPVVRFDSFCLLIAIAAYFNLAIGQMDIKGAYLNRTLNTEIYMKQPKGCEDETGRVCRLNHTLYGLKQSGREWNKTLKSFLIYVAGFKQLIKEHGIFYRKNSDGYDIIAVWVDDLFMISTSGYLLEKMKDKIKKKWESTDQGEPKLLLGIKLESIPEINGIKIH